MAIRRRVMVPPADRDDHRGCTEGIDAPGQIERVVSKFNRYVISRKFDPKSGLGWNFWPNLSNL
jgi:hypothetical protein